jgi:hypothetical protein
MTDRLDVFPRGMDGRRQTMRTPDEVASMQRLDDLGWGTRRIAAEMGCNRETVQRYLDAGGWTPWRVPTRAIVQRQSGWFLPSIRMVIAVADRRLGVALP